MSMYESLGDLVYQAMAATGKEQHMKLQVSQEVLDEMTKQFTPKEKITINGVDKKEPVMLKKFVFSAGTVELEVSP